MQFIRLIPGRFVWIKTFQFNPVQNIILFLGAETTSSSLLWSFLFLLHHPEVQSQVQSEIDSVVEGRNVLLEDKASLPYTNAVLMESMRMATIVPNALPHSAMEDIQYNGYIIPKVGPNQIILSL